MRPKQDFRNICKHIAFFFQMQVLQVYITLQGFVEISMDNITSKNEI
jgi:hypothetical protein